MLRAVLISLLLVVQAGIANAQACGTVDLIAELGPEDRAHLDALVAPHPFPEGILWRATKDGKTVTVVGTIHLPDPRLAPIVAQVRPALEASDLLIIEASSEDEAAMQTLAVTNPEMFFITEGPTLIDLLTTEEWQQVNDRLAELDIPGFFAAKFQPWYMSMALAVPPCAMNSLKTGEKGLDRQLELLANAADIPIATLDDTEAVLRLFADEPLDVQLDGLRVSLKTQADGDASTSTLIEAYFEGRIRESWEFARILIGQSGIENGAEMFEEINQTVLIGRNADWEKQLSDLIEGKNVVIAVGAAHLSGESGVLRALERLDYEVEPL